MVKCEISFLVRSSAPPYASGQSYRRRQTMKPLGGPHHFTGVTADVQTNVDFWCGVMGLRFVKNTLNYETTFRYHTYFGDEDGDPGSVVTFLEFEEAPRGVPGRGDIHRLVLRVGSYDSLEYWMDRFIANEVFSELLRLDPTQPQSLVFHDPEGHEVELMVSDAKDKPLVADADDIPAEHRIRGIEGARSYTTIEEMLPWAEFMGFRRDGDHLVFDGTERSGRWWFSPPPDRPSRRRSPRGRDAHSVMDVVDLVGRILFALLFLDNGWAHCTKRTQMVPFGRSIGAPFAEFSVPFTGVMMLVGGVLIILGVWADLGALLLVLFLPAAGYLGHPYWRDTDPMMRAAQKAQFWKNIALAGAALFFLYAFYEFGEGIALTVGDSPSLFA